MDGWMTGEGAPVTLKHQGFIKMFVDQHASSAQGVFYTIQIGQSIVVEPHLADR